jgi:hypothetical protein
MSNRRQLNSLNIEKLRELCVSFILPTDGRLKADLVNDLTSVMDGMDGLESAPEPGGAHGMFATTFGVSYVPHRHCVSFNHDLPVSLTNSMAVPRECRHA